MVPDFSLPANFDSAVGFGSLEISSDQLLSSLALRLTTNQRAETIFTSTPTADLDKPLSATPIYFPQFADGGGYTTTILLLNTSISRETGTMTISDDNGEPLVVNQVGGIKGSSFAYAIPPGGVFVLQTDGSASDVKVGAVRLTPDAGTSTPAGSGIFRYSTGGVMVTESGVPAATPTTHARIYVDKSGGHDTGLAVAAVSESATDVAVRAFQQDGSTPAGAGYGTVGLVGNGHEAAFVGQLISGLPAGFTGVLDISSAVPFVALTLRSLTNERGDFLLTTFPIADANQAAPAPIVFPQIADGGGYLTECILLSATGGASTTFHLFGDTGALLAVIK